MHTLRLINDEGDVVREWESDVTWRQEWVAHGEAAFSSFHGICEGRNVSVIPADHLIIEVSTTEEVRA